MLRLKQLRENKDISQTQLADMLGLVKSTISHYESGRRQPDPDTLSKLADIFEVSIDYLLGRTEEAAPQFAIPDNLRDVQFAFYEGLQDLTQEDLDAVSDFVEFIRSKKEKKKK